MGRLWVSVGALKGLLAVALGAFAAHGLRDQLDEGLLAIWETASHYLGTHALALLACGLLLAHRPRARLIQAAALAFAIGTLLFSGSLYLLVLTETRAWGAVTPFGGVTLIVAWGLLALGGWLGLREPKQDHASQAHE